MPLAPSLLRPRLVRWALLALVALSVSLVCAPANAGTQVIEPGREAEVLALFAPYRLTQEVAPGWKLWNVQIRPREIVVELQGAGTPPRTCEVRMRHHSETDSRTFHVSTNFAFYFPAEPPSDCRAAVDRLVAAVKEHDTGTFWQHEVDSVEVDPVWMRWSDFIHEPLLPLAGFVALVIGMLVRELLRLPPRWRWGLVAILGLGTVLRLTITPEQAALDAWPFSRAPMLASQIWHGPLIGQLSMQQPFFLTDIIFKTGLVFGLLGPAVIFIHAWRMLGSHRAAVFAAGLLAVWPSHLRFSHADGTFVSSIVFSGMSFALAHDALRHPSRNWRWCALGLLVPVALETFALRPLNQIFAALLIAAALFLGRDIPRGRRLLVAGVVAAATLGIAIPRFLSEYGSQVHGAGLGIVGGALSALFSYRLNTLIRVDMTPPLALVLAVVGAVTLWRHQRRVSAFLCGWLGLFFVTHSVVLPASPYMQARYHLHLIVPVALLAGAGLEELVKRRARVGAAAAGFLLLSPAVHHGFIRHMDLNQPAEFAFVSSLRRSIPEGCTVVEYAGRDSRNLRLTRIGTTRSQAVDRMHYEVVPVPKGSPDVERLLAEARKQPCAMTYLGIECYVDGDPAPQCTALRQASTGVVKELERDNHVYDENNTFANRDRKRFKLGLYSLTPSPPSAASAP